MEARDEKRLLRFQKHLASFELLILDELGFVPLSKTGPEMLFKIFSQRYERSAMMVTSNLPFNEWTDRKQHVAARRLRSFNCDWEIYGQVRRPGPACFLRHLELIGIKQHA